MQIQIMHKIFWNYICIKFVVFLTNNDIDMHTCNNASNTYNYTHTDTNIYIYYM